MTTKPLPAKKRTSIGARRSPETEAAVLTAAKELIGEKGYAGFSVDEVARRADTRNLVEDLVQYTAGLWRFWASHPAGAALRGLIAEAQGTKEARPSSM